jgi:hypothetical protein
MPDMAPTVTPISALLVAAQRALGLNQERLGKILGGVTRRTVWRYQGGHSTPQPHELHDLARHVFLVDASLAGQLAAASGATLESLGLVTAAPKAEATPVSLALAPVDPIQARLLADAVVCAAAEALDVSPRVIRSVLHTAFVRASETGLSVDAIAKALAPTPVDGAKGKTAKG